MPLAHLGTLDVLHDAAAPPRPVLVLDERLACTWDPYQSMPELRLIQEEEKEEEEEEEEEDEEEATVKMRRKANRPLRDCIYIYIPHHLYSFELHQCNMWNEGLRVRMGSLARLGR